MIKCEVIKRFRLKDFDKLKNIERASINVPGQLMEKDTFECDEEMMKYLSGDNALKKSFIKVIEVVPETQKAKKEENKEEKETTKTKPKKRTTKKEK